ncbi:MAG: type II secretion system F family protein [Planctomycetes bacterium]|nr:type II secretion system F family protein [Planctomycetota bacterium]
MQFEYLARDLSGKMQSGVISADNTAEAARKLRQDGLFTLTINEARVVASTTGSSLFARRISRSDIVYLSSQLAVMVDAGIPVASALAGLAKQSENPSLRTILEKIQQDVEGGVDFSVALAKYPRYFDGVYVNLVKAGEVSGLLGALLERIATQMRSDLEQRQKVRGALMYPGVMMAMCMAACAFLLTFVLPKISPMFVARGIELPTPTIVMMTASHILTHYWWACLLGAVGLGSFWWYARQKWWGKMAFDWVILQLPVLGPLMRKSILARTTRTFAAMLNAGVPVLDGIQLCAAVSENIFYERAWKDLADKVTTGCQIHEVLESNPLFPKTLVQMIGSGEQTGKLGMVLGRVGNYYDSEVNIAIKSATSLLEPIMVAGMGVIVGGLALAMLLPIFKLSSHVG